MPVTGNWNTPSSWANNAVPTTFDDVIINAGSTITIDPTAGISSCKSLTVNGKLIYASTASFIVGDFNNRTAEFIVNGTFEFSVGYGFTIYGYLKFNAGSVFKMYSGGMIIDGTLGAGTSVAANQPLLDVTDIGTLDVYRSTIAIRNPHFDAATPCIAGAKRFGNTIAFGSGTSPDVNNNYLVSETNKPVFSNIEVNIFNTTAITSRLKVTNIQIDSAVSVISGTFWNYSTATPVKVKGDFNISQGVNIIGNFEFNGTGQQNINPQYSSGATLVTFQGDLIVNNPTEVKSKINVTIQGGDLRFIQGRFDTEAKLLTLERPPIAANSSSYIITYNFYQDIGHVLIKNIVGKTLFPVGTSTSYAPVWVNPPTVSNFKVSVTPYITIPASGLTPPPYEYINLKWDVTRVFGAPTASLTFQWNTSDETTGFTNLRDHCAIFHHNGLAWEDLTYTVGATSVGSVHTKTATNVGSFSPFTLFASAVLPAEISEFKGKKVNNRAQLSWTTASEKDVQGFEIERNTEGSLFETIGFVKSQGASNTSTNYVFWDNNFDKTAYYRLKIMGLDGKETYSKIISIENKAQKDAISIFPNPILRGSVLNIQSAGNTDSDKFKVEVFNVNGQLITQQRGIAPLQTDYWLNGVYLVKIVNNVNVVTFKVIKN